MPTFKISDLDKKIEPHLNRTPPANWQQFDGKRKVDFDQAEADLKRPTLFSDPSGWWAGLTDDQKQEALDTLGELAGGTVGAVAGGGTPLSIPGAGAGAVAGRSVARLAGKAAGLKTTPKTGMEELGEIAKTAALNAGGEAIGAGIALGKPLAKRALQKAIKVDPHVAQLAENAGIQLTPGMLTKRPMVKWGEAVLENTMGGMGEVRGATGRAIEANEANLRKIPEKFHPTPVDRPEAGSTLQKAVSGNEAAIESHFTPRYNTITGAAGDAPIDVGQLRDTARDFLQQVPKQLQGAYFGGPTIQKLEKAAGMMDGQVIRQPGGGVGLIDGPVPVLTFSEAQSLRTSLLRAQRRMTGNDEALYRESIPALRDALDRSIDDSLAQSSNPIHQQALKDWRQTNKEYGDSISKISGADPKRGNATADVISDAKNPDYLVNQVANSPTAIREAEVATTPMLGATDLNAMGKLRRNRADELIDSSLIKHPWQQDNRRIVSPDAMERTLTRRDGTQELLSPANLELQDNIQLGKAILGPSTQRNTSNTARFGQALNLGTAAGGAASGIALGDDDMYDRGRNALIGGVVGGVGIPKAIGMIWKSPTFSKMITKPPGPLAAPVLEPLLGASSRAIMELKQLPSPRPIEQQQAEDLKPKTVRFKISDFE